jgi:hypothetical protein
MALTPQQQAFEDDQRRLAEERFRLYQEQQARVRASAAATAARTVARNAEGYASWLIHKAAGWAIEVRYASALVHRTTEQTPAELESGVVVGMAEFASPLRARPGRQGPPRKRRDWVAIVIEAWAPSDLPATVALQKRKRG